MSTALLAASQTLQALLLADLQADPVLQLLFPPLGTSVVSIATPDGMVAQDLTGVSVWLYRVARDEQRLNQPPLRLPPDRVRPPPLPVRLHYLLTPVMRSSAGDPAPETDQHVLGAILRSFHSRPLLSGSYLAGSLAGTDRQIAVRLENPGLEEIARIWDTLEQPYRASLCYEVGIIEVETARLDERGPLVLESAPSLGIAAHVLGEATP
ncbi:DUF4255 domain-containing protein [Falsiroseomonas sp. E2-1-a4]|uniref:DUF4255 domain-containing protein n=1 Tax=Falsiroseomonas sp. E2-1-a4 TaxID=3239299 RepID=UPI003F2AE9E9